MSHHHKSTQVYECRDTTKHLSSTADSACQDDDDRGSVCSYGSGAQHTHRDDVFIPPARETDEVLVVVLFSAARYHSFRNSVIRETSIIKNYGGVIVGISKETTVEEGVFPKDKAVGLLKFHSIAHAKKWMECDPICKQQDWLDSVDIVIIPMYTPMNPIKDKKTVFIQIVDVGVQDPKTFYKGYLEPCIEILKKSCGNNISNYECTVTEKIRGLWEPGHVIIHQWQNENDFRNFYNSNLYGEYKKCRQSAAESAVITCECVSVM